MLLEESLVTVGFVELESQLQIPPCPLEKFVLTSLSLWNYFSRTTMIWRVWVCVFVCEGDLLTCLTWHASGRPTGSVSRWRSWESSSCSLHRAGCLSSSDLALKVGGIPGQLLVVSLHWKPAETGVSGERTDELARKSEARTPKQGFLPARSLTWAVTRRCRPHLGRLPVQITSLRTPLAGVSSGIFVDPVKLATEASHQKSAPYQLDTQPYLLMSCFISKWEQLSQSSTHSDLADSHNAV